MAFELWDTKSGNLINTFDDRASALKAVLVEIQVNGWDYASDLLLAFENKRGDTRVVAEGEQLTAIVVAQIGNRAALPAEPERSVRPEAVAPGP